MVVQGLKIIKAVDIQKLQQHNNTLCIVCEDPAVTKPENAKTVAWQTNNEVVFYIKKYMWKSIAHTLTTQQILNGNQICQQYWLVLTRIRPRFWDIS